MSSDRRHGGLPLAIYVIALLMAPLAAVGMFGAREISRNNDLARTTTQLANLVELRAASATMRAPLQIERLASLGVSRIAELELEPEPVIEMTGLDFTELRASNRIRLDDAIDRVLDAVADEELVEVWRVEFVEVVDDLNVMLDRLDAGEIPATTEIDVVFQAVSSSLDSLAETTTREADLVVPPSLREASLVANVVAVSEVASSAASEIEVVTDAALLGVTPGMSEMFGSTFRHTAALDAAAPVDRLGVAELQDRYDELAELGPELYGAEASMLDLGVVTAVSDALVGRVEYLDAVSAFAFEQTNNAVSVIEQQRDRAAIDNRNTLLVFGGVGLATILFGVIVIRSFAKPLTRLRLQAERIGRGELAAEPLRLEGPSDVRKVTGALNDMSSTLALVDDHMQALALSDLDAGPELGQLPGKVGASMRNSMERVTALTTRLRASEARLAEEARIDNLTGLPNRFAVLEHLDRLLGALSGDDGIVWAPTTDEAAGRAATVGVMFLDVDGFKSVNDTHGHAVGDVVLREIARRLRGSVREIDFVARLGGDEFLIIVAGVSDAESLAGFGQRLITEIEQPYVVGDQLFAVSASVGATLIDTDDDALAAIERADAAVYQAKRRGRRRVEMYDHELQASIEQQAELELALRQAIQHDELRVHLQPLADLATGRSIGAEALVRWERPGVGLVPPGDFIPIAERSGLIFDLERWVLRAACQRIAEWRIRGVGEGMRLAVNISGRHLIEGDLVAALDSVLEATGADPNLLEIELTESHLLDDVNRAKAVLAGLRSRGIKVAIDDFGTGYSSMTYLQKLPVDIVKIDRSFVNSATSNEFDSTVIESVVTISRALSLEIVAEGIETVEQLEYVTQAGCHYGQGFHLARPMPADEAEAIMFGPPMIRRAPTSWADAPPVGERVSTAHPAS